MRISLSSRVGHATAVVGALVVAFGALVPEWQRFELAGIAARGFEVPLVAQIVLMLAPLVVVAAVLGWATPYRRRFGGAALAGSLFLTGWVAAAHVGRGAGLPLMAYETIAMGPGWYIALVGAVLANAGGLVAVLGRPVVGGPGTRS